MKNPSLGVGSGGCSGLPPRSWGGRTKLRRNVTQHRLSSCDSQRGNFTAKGCCGKLKEKIRPDCGDQRRLPGGGEGCGGQDAGQWGSEQRGRRHWVQRERATFFWGGGAVLATGWQPQGASPGLGPRLTFRGDADPVEVAGQLLGDVGLAAGREAHHDDHRGRVGELRPTGCGEQHRRGGDEAPAGGASFTPTSKPPNFTIPQVGALLAQTLAPTALRSQRQGPPIPAFPA